MYPDQERFNELEQIVQAIACGNCTMQGSRGMACEDCTNAQQRAMIERIIYLEREEEMRAEMDSMSEEEVEATMAKIRQSIEDRAVQITTLQPSPLTPEERAALEEQEKIDAGEDIDVIGMPFGIYNREELYEKVLQDTVNSWDHDDDAHKHNTPCRVCMAELALDGKNPWK